MISWDPNTIKRYLPVLCVATDGAASSTLFDRQSRDGRSSPYRSVPHWRRLDSSREEALHDGGKIFLAVDEQGRRVYLGDLVKKIRILIAATHSTLERTNHSIRR